MLLLHNSNIFCNFASQNENSVGFIYAGSPRVRGLEGVLYILKRRLLTLCVGNR